MSVSNRLTKLEQRPLPPRKHGMTQAALLMHLETLSPRELNSFAKSMTVEDLNANINYLKNLTEQQHAEH